MHIMGARNGDVPTHRDAVLDALTRDPDNPASVVSGFARARERAGGARRHLSRDVGGDQHDAPALRDGDLSPETRLQAWP